MLIPKFLQTYLASYDLSALDLKKDRKLIITEILNKGDFDALRWVTKNYSKNEVKDVVLNPRRGFWLRTTLNYWLKVFNVKQRDGDFDEAIINLRPR